MRTGLSRRSALAGLGAGGIGVALAARGAAAQETADATAHPIVGLWTHARGPETPPGLRAFTAIHGDGTVSMIHSFGGPGVGAWQPTGERSVQWLVTFLNIADTPGGFAEGTVTVAGTLTVDDAGTTVTEESTVEIRTPDNVVVGTFPFATTFNRVQVEAPSA
jgi:hypothetical protein